MRLQSFIAVVGLWSCASALAEDSPTVVWASDPVRPDETVLVQGGGFGSDPTIEVRPAEGADAAMIGALQASDQNLKVVIPRDWSLNAYAFRIGVGNRWSEWCLLNLPDVWWTQGDHGNGTAAAGGWLRIFGKCLSFDAPTQVRLAPGEGETITLRVVRQSCYALSVDLPESLAPGELRRFCAQGVRLHG